MQIVIDIPEEEYNYVKTQVAFGITNPLKIRIANGKPLVQVLDELKAVKNYCTDNSNNY